MNMATIKRVYTRHYRDNDANKAYAEWSDGSRSEGKAVNYHGVLLPERENMGALFDYALQSGLTIKHEIWGHGVTVPY